MSVHVKPSPSWLFMNVKMKDIRGLIAAINYSLWFTRIQVTVNELFQDVTYQPVLVRAHSFSPLSPLSPTEPGRLSPLTMPLSDSDSNKVVPKDIVT